MATIAEWSSLYAVEMTVPGQALKVLMARLEYLGIVFVPVAWLVTAAILAGHPAWFSPRRLLLLAVLPALTLLVIWTNDTHQWIGRLSLLTQEGPFAVVTPDRGPLFWLFVAYSYTLILVGTCLIVRASLRAWRLYRQQTLGLILGVLATWFFNVIYLSRA